MEEKLRSVLDDLLRPLLQADGGDMELVRVDATRVVVRVSGQAAYGAGSHYVRVHVIEPALLQITGSDVTIEFEKAVPKPPRRQSNPA